MKIKTSISLEKSILERAKQIAHKEDRSTSYILEKIIESVLNAADHTDSFADAVKKVAEQFKASGKEKINAARNE